MENYFKSEKVNAAFSIWMNNSPESFHPSDMERWTEFVLTLLDENEELQYSVLNSELGPRFYDEIREIQISSFWSQYSGMKALYGKLLHAERIKK